MKFFLILFSFAVLSTGCLKKDTGCPYTVRNITVPAAEITLVENYLNAAGITNATKHSSGMYYVIENAGTGTNVANQCSQVAINYKGQLTNGQVFDEGNNRIFTLGTLIEGWKIALPLIKDGGKIKLFIPPSLGYGAQDVRDQAGNIVIPGNSVLVFDISLISTN